METRKEKEDNIDEDKQKNIQKVFWREQKQQPYFVS